MDWATELIEEMKRGGIDDADDATRLFCECYRDGDTLDALKKYVMAAKEQKAYHGEPLLVFKDGSCYASWQLGTLQFYNTIGELREAYPDALMETVEDMYSLFGAGIITNDRGQGCGGPGFLSEYSVIEDEDIANTPVIPVTEAEDMEAWELARDAVDANEVDMDITVVCVGEATDDGYQIIYAI